MNNVVLPENTNVGDVVYKLEGSDPENSPVHFGLRGTDLLKVNKDTGDVTLVKPLDREINDTLNFFVSIEDEVKDAPVGGNNLVEIPVTVIVLDVNDNAPSFEHVPYKIEVKEDTPVGTTIFSNIELSDADSLGDSLEVECIDIPGSEKTCEKFQIQTIDSDQNKYTGAIILNSPLDYASKESYTFILQATVSTLSIMYHTFNTNHILGW